MFSTILIETLIHFLGQFDLSKTHWSWIPEFTFFGIRSPRKAPKSVGNSPSQARLLALLIASILHGSFFVMMGSRGSFWVMFFAYSVAAFARSILTGKHSAFRLWYFTSYIHYPSKATLNAYFVSGYKQSVGFAFGLWSKLSPPLEGRVWPLFPGFGGVVSPIVCQALIAIGIPYYQFYFGSLVLSGFNIAFLVATYMPTPREFATDRESTITAVAKHKVCLTPTSTPSTPLSDGAPNLPIKPETRGKSKGDTLGRGLRSSVLNVPQHFVPRFQCLSIGLWVFLLCFTVAGKKSQIFSKCKAYVQSVKQSLRLLYDDFHFYAKSNNSLICFQMVSYLLGVRVSTLANLTALFKFIECQSTERGC